MPYRTHAELLVKEPTREHTFSNWFRRLTFRERFLSKPKPIEEEPQVEESHRERLGRIAKSQAAKIKAAEEKAKRKAIEKRSEYIAEYVKLWAGHFMERAEILALKGEKKYKCELILPNKCDDGRQGRTLLMKMGAIDSTGHSNKSMSDALWRELREAIITHMTSLPYDLNFDRGSNKSPGNVQLPLTFWWVE